MNNAGGLKDFSDVHSSADQRQVQKQGFEDTHGRSIRDRGLNKGRAKPAPQKSDPAKIFRAFNTWAFKREQPDNPALMLSIVTAAVEAGNPIPFVLYWGKGLRCSIDAPDLVCLDYLGALAGRIREAYEPGASITLILTDTHADNNGHPRTGTRAYFDEIARAAQQRGFQTCWLGQVTEETQAQPSDPVENDRLWEGLRDTLSHSAAKWYRGDGTVAEGARKYFLLNMTEKRAVELAFPGSIFVTFNGSEFRPLFPDGLPVFYMYSMRRGVGVKPWFASSQGASPELAPTA